MAGPRAWHGGCAAAVANVAAPCPTPSNFPQGCLPLALSGNLGGLTKSFTSSSRSVCAHTDGAKALSVAGLSDEEDQKPVRLPLRVPVELQPRNNHAWARVQSLAQNPRLR